MKRFDLVVIGGGPGGYTAAARAASLGLSVALVEKRGRLGGTCLLEGCIPTKELLESSKLFTNCSGARERGVQTRDVSLDLGAMHARKRRVVDRLSKSVLSLMKKHRVTVYHGKARLTGERVVHVAMEDGGDLALQASKTILAAGSKPVSPPVLQIDGESIIDSTTALSLDSVPSSMVVVGAGAVGLELGLVWSRLGCSVTVVEMMPQVAPFADRQIARGLERSLRSMGMTLKLGAKVSGFEKVPKGCEVRLDTPKGEEVLHCELVLSAVGRVPLVEDLGLEEVGCRLDDRGRVDVTSGLETSVEGVYAIGDMVAGPMLAHKAEHDGVVAAENAAGRTEAVVDYSLVPSVVYTSPELAQVGFTEEQARDAGHDTVTGLCTFRGNGRALTAGEEEGLVKVVAEKGTRRILGVHVLGPHASEIIASAALAMRFGATARDVALAVFAHPTLSEAFKEACAAVP